MRRTGASTHRTASFTTSHAIERRVSAHEGLYRSLSLGGNDIIDGRAAPMPSAEFSPRRSNGDTLVDFIGNGAAAGDTFQFVGYGTAGAGATFTQLDATHWRMNSSDGAVHDTITLSNGASVHASDFLFV